MGEHGEQMRSRGVESLAQALGGLEDGDGVGKWKTRGR